VLAIASEPERAPAGGAAAKPAAGVDNRGGDEDPPRGACSVSLRRVLVARKVGLAGVRWWVTVRQGTRGWALTSRLLVLAAAVLWGTTGTAQALAPPGAEPASVGGIRVLIGGTALLALAVLRSREHWSRAWLSAATALAAVGVAIYQVCFFAGVARSGVALGTIVTIGSSPIFAGLFGWVARRARPEPGWGLATALALTGAVLLLLPRHEGEVDPVGVALTLGAGASYAAFAVASKVSIDAGRPPLAVMGVAFSGGALLLSPVVMMSDLSWLQQPRGLAVALHLGAVTTVLAYVLFGRGLQGTPVTTAATLSLAEPLTAASLGVLVLRERLTGLGVLGAGLLLAGLVILAWWPARSGQATALRREQGASSGQ